MITKYTLKYPQGYYKEQTSFGLIYTNNKREAFRFSSETVADIFRTQLGMKGGKIESISL